MKIGLFFGSFNPVHVGHMIIANFMVQHADLSEIWMVISPHNPNKEKSSLAKDYDRLNLVNLAIGESPGIRASDIEFQLPKPSYTIDTLTYLRQKYPDKEFVLIMGGDNLATLHKWKNYEAILQHYQVYVYKRPSYDLGELVDHPSVQIFEAPLMYISASYIRSEIKAGNDVKYLVPLPVYEYLSKSRLYK